MDQLALVFLLAGLGIVLVIFIVLGLSLYAWQRNRRRRVHIENVTITNKNFDSQSKYSKTDSTDYITSGRSPGLALTRHFHHGLGIPKKTFEAPSAPLTPPSSSSPTSSITTDVESTTAKINDHPINGSLRSVIIIDDESETEPIESRPEVPTSNTQINEENKSLPILVPIQQLTRPETAPPTASNARSRNFLIEIPESMPNARHSFSADAKRESLTLDPTAATPRRFSHQMEKLQEHENERLYSEFDKLNQHVIVKASNDGQTLKNIRRNRYFDIVPYDENRVKLVGIENDYINASYIRDSSGTDKYIATQGPIDDSETGRRESTVVDFWRMVWQEKIDCIVMLTQCVENRKQKCARYWPENVDENEKIDDELNMNLYCYTEDEICFTREIWLEKKNEGTRKIIQWHYKNWNDAEGPACNESFLTFIDNIRKSTKNTPILVHCSAGVGRTSVYIGLDILLDRLESESIIDVFDTVQSLRKNRPNMIQTCAQYISLYELIAMAIQKSK